MKLLTGGWGRAGKFGAARPAGAKLHETEKAESSVGVHRVVLCVGRRGDMSLSTQKGVTEAVPGVRGQQESRRAAQQHCQCRMQGAPELSF